jgi:N-methylhydantoinase A
MSLAVRGVSVERGYDPRDFALVAMGGGGPPHALAIARDLHIPQVIIPNLPAHFSALGMLMSDVRHDYVRTYYRAFHDSDFEELHSIYDELIATGKATLTQEGVDASARTFQRSMDLRYVGQEFSLQVPVSEVEIGTADVETIKRRFDQIHERRFGHAAVEEQIELVNLRLTALGARTKINFPRVSESQAAARNGTRSIYLDDAERPANAAVYQRTLLAPDARVAGPAVIEEYGSTTVLFEGDAATVADTGEIIVTVGPT